MATLKNTTIDDTGFLTIPSGTILQRPASPSAGMFRYNTDFQTEEYYDGTQWVNTTQIPIVTNGLVLYLDAGEPASYPGSGDVWYNLASTGGSISKGTYLPQYTTLGGATCFNFNQVGAYFQNDTFFSTQIPSDSTNLTIDVWFYPAVSELSAGDRGNLIRANNGSSFYMSWNKSNQKQSNYWYGKTNEGYHESGNVITRGTWNNVVAVWNSSSLSQFLNNNKTTAVTSGTAAFKTSGIQIGWEANERQFSGGIAIIKIYDIALTDTQVQQNYFALKNRFGL